VARLGGDEFVVVAQALDLPDHELTVAHKIRESLRPGILVGQHELFITPSVGIALIPRDGSDADTLLRHADSAMYRAKADGRDAVCFFDPAMAAAAERYLKTESSLRRAIQRDEFEPYYPPVVRLADGALVGMELLVRWHHPELGLVMPASFIPVAEESGLVAQIGTLTLDAACRQIRRWQAQGLAVPKLAINLAAMQFRERPLIESIMRVMASHGVPASAVELEITETALMQDGEKTLATLQWLADEGFAMAVDDFGTGYSSLAYLKRFPVSKLKIDRSFILDMTKNPEDEAIVQTIVALARTLRLSTTAEGVETQAQADMLARLGCDFVQGFLYARPMPAAQLEQAFLR
jgi:predicted signal transduction protein with EAL and GGDEF domain